MVELESFVPQSLEEATSLLLEYGKNAKVIAGGTDLLVQMKKEEKLPGVFINISRIKDLNYIAYDENHGLRIGPLTKLRFIVDSPVIKSHFNIIALAASMLGTPTIRNHATIGGNLCNAAPSADMAPALLVCGAKVKVRSFEGERELSIENFFIGPGQTAIKHSELLTEIQVPNLPTRSGSVYLKQTRTNGADLAVVGVAAMVEMDGEVVKDAKIALGAVAPTPFRVKNAERSLRGKSLDESILEEVAQMASLEAKPIDDVRSSADYRRKLIYVLAKRAIKGAINETG